MKKYRLKKDLPDSKAGDVYYLRENQYGISGGRAYFKDDNPQESYWLPKNVENNPEWFSEIKEPERIEVKDFQALHNIEYEFVTGGGSYGFKVNKSIPPEKYSAIKEAIEEVLNDEEKIRMTAIKERDGLFKIGNKYYVEDGRFGRHKYTVKDMEDCFNEGKGIALAGVKFMDKTMYYKKHESFKDYLQSLNK